MAETGWLYLAGRIIGSPADGYKTCWDTDHDYKRTAKSAIKHGLREVGSDDFRICYVKNGVLRKVQWMEEAPSYWDEIEEIAEQFNLKPTRKLGLHIPMNSRAGEVAI